MRYVACFLLLMSAVQADVKSVVALEVRSGENTLQRGSAVLIATAVEAPANTGQYTLLTASHCVVNSQVEKSDSPVIREEFPSGTVIEVYLKSAWYPCTVNSYSSKGDVAILEVESDEEVPLTPLAKECSPVDHKVTACGFVLGLDQHSMLSVVKSKAFFPTCDSLTCPTNSVIHGMSGGAVFNDSGELCGIISSINPKAPWVSYYTHADELNRFIKTYEPRKLRVGPKPAKPVVGDRAVPRHISN